MHTLITFLGKGRDDPNTGYRRARYRFPDGTGAQTAFFGLALAEKLAPERLLLLGTDGSQWDVLVENLAARGEDEDQRIDLMDAVAAKRVHQDLLDRVAPLIQKTLGRDCLLKLIPYGRDERDHATIIGAISEHAGKGRVSLDLTHGFRHLPMLGLLSGFFLERVGKLDVAGLYYGALEMMEDGVAPVLRLDNLMAIERWLVALDRFDESGDYGVFTTLLVADGVPQDKAECLTEAAFHERTFNLADAARKLRNFLPVLDAGLPGPGALFQRQLGKRLEWVREAGLFEQQRKLAHQYLGRRDYVRAAVFAWEALVTRECQARGYDDSRYKEGREPAIEALEAEIQADEHPDWKRHAYWTLKNLRNALAHGNAPSIERYRAPLRSEERLREELKSAISRLIG